MRPFHVLFGDPLASLRRWWRRRYTRSQLWIAVITSAALMWLVMSAPGCTHASAYPVATAADLVPRLRWVESGDVEVLVDYRYRIACYWRKGQMSCAQIPTPKATSAAPCEEKPRSPAAPLDADTGDDGDRYTGVW